MFIIIKYLIFRLVTIDFFKRPLYHIYREMREKSFFSLSIPIPDSNTSKESLLPPVTGLEFLPASCAN